MEPGGHYKKKSSSLEIGRATERSSDAAKVASIKATHKTHGGKEVETYIVIDALEDDGRFKGYLLRKVWGRGPGGRSRVPLRVDLWDDDPVRDSSMRGFFKSWRRTPRGTEIVSVLDETAPGLSYQSKGNQATVTYDGPRKLVLRGKVVGHNQPADDVVVRMKGLASAIAAVGWLINLKDDVEGRDHGSKWKSVFMLKNGEPSIEHIVDKDLAYARKLAPSRPFPKQP